MLLCAVMAFAACEQAPIEEQSAIRYEAPDTITVGFEGDDTRIQLNEAQKTVWTKGDQVSVFYKSYDNLKFEFEGNTGDRNGTLKRVGGQHNGQTMDDVVVVYPYSADYMITLSEGCVNATIPSTQTYLNGSYGVGDNLMIARSSFNQFSLKSVCGWLKIQLTGDGEVIERITFRGNDGEQVAGLVYVDATTAEATLATAKHNSDDNSQLDGTLVLDDSIYTEVTLDCGDGVALGKNATAFYIALPPQTFEQGFTVVIEDTEGYVMEQSTDKTLIIERNHIQPMAALEFINPNRPSQPTPASNQIWYTSSDGNIVEPYNTNVFGATIISNEYNNGMGIITFDGDVTSIGEDAFYKCTSLTSVNISDNVTTIGNYAFQNCTSLTSVSISDNVTTIGNYAFQYCDSLTSVTIGDSVTSIGDRAFEDCDSLTSVTIGNSVTSIGYRAFYSCDSLTNVTIPDSVTTIGNYAFYSCDSLTSVTIGDSVTTIGEQAFSYCSSLSSVTIGNSVMTIGKSTFYECNSLTSVTIPDSVTTIEDFAFESCFSLTSATIGDNVQTIGCNPFLDCDNLKEFKGKFAADGGRCLIKDNTIIAYAEASGTTYTIPDSVTTIGEAAFEYCKSLTSVTIPDSVTTIGYCAFYNCDSLESATIGNSVQAIGVKAFCFCDSLTRVTMGNSLQTIGTLAFYSCNSLTSATIPDSVTSIGERAFEGCTSLTSVTIGDGLTTIGWSAFHSCNSLTSVTIGNSVTTIGDRAFGGCTSLTSVTIPDSVTTIGDGLFSNCDNLKTVYCKPTTPPMVGENMFFHFDGFTGYNIRCMIYVPASDDDSIIKAYKEASGWSEYASDIVSYDFENGVVVE